MIDVQSPKLLAQLNPKNCRFDTGAGGEREFMPTDYAAAVALWPKGLPRDLFSRMFWLEGITMTDREVMTGIDAAINAEWLRREDGMLNALLLIAQHGGTKAQPAYARASARRWPPMLKNSRNGDTVVSDKYLAIRRAAYEEVMAAEKCPKCKGRCEFEDAKGVRFECRDCLGEGIEIKGVCERAEAIGIDPQNYTRRGWGMVFTWAVSEIRRLIKEGDTQYLRALGVVK